MADVTKPASAEEASIAAAQRAAAGAGGVSDVLATQAREVAERALAVATAFEEGAVARARRVEASVADAARDIEGSARELMAQLKEVRDAARSRSSGSGGTAGSAGAGTGAGERAADDDGPLAASRRMADKAREVVARWRSSVSVPAPPSVSAAPGDAAAAAADGDAASAAAGSTAPAAEAAAAASTVVEPIEAAAAAPPALRRAAPAASLGDADFPLSDAPVLQVVPTRTLRTGLLVPQYIEAPLYAKPPDHAFLTPEEAEQEEDIRLALYSDIAARVHTALVMLERQVFAHRRAHGAPDRIMEGVMHPSGPSAAELEIAEVATLAPLFAATRAEWAALWSAPLGRAAVPGHLAAKAGLWATVASWTAPSPPHSRPMA